MYIHDSSDSKAPVYNAGDPGSIPGSGRSTGEGNGNPLQYYCLENPMNRGAWLATVHGVTKSRTRLSDLTFTLGGFSVLCKSIWASQVALVVKNSPASAGDMRDMGSTLGSGRSSGGGHGNLLQYSWLENSIDRGAGLASSHRVTKSHTD